MSDAPIAKVCTRCSTDVAGRPRVKDARGRYLCRPCFDAAAAKAARKAGPSPDEPVRIAGIHDGAPGDAPAEASAPADNNAHIFDLAPIGGGPPKGGGPCPTCGHFLAPGVRICVNCGFNTSTGAVLSTSVGIDKVKGSKETIRDDHLAAESRAQGRKAYRTAVAVLVCGILGSSSPSPPSPTTWRPTASSTCSRSCWRSPGRSWPSSFSRCSGPPAAPGSR